MMPKIDGLKVCIEIRKDKNIPIIIISAKSQDVDKIQGLTLGADNLGRVFSAEEIFKEVWKEKYFEGNNTVMVHDLNEHIKKEREWEREKYNLITNLSHDLRTPLTSILGFLELMLK